MTNFWDGMQALVCSILTAPMTWTDQELEMGVASPDFSKAPWQPMWNVSLVSSFQTGRAELCGIIGHLCPRGL